MHDGFNKKLGFGLGFRQCHFNDIVASQHQSQWFEAITENYLGIPGLGPGPSLLNLEKLRSHYPVVLHGVSLSIGGTDPINVDYLNAAQKLFDRIEPEWVSDHLCWTGVHGRQSHDLLPLPYTRDTVKHVVSRIQFVQEFWQRPLVIENVSSYVTYHESEMSEAEFLSEVIKASGCKLLLDVNNIYVSSRNHGADPEAYLKIIPWPEVVQMHLAGHTDHGDFVIDTHDHEVCDDVWSLYEKALCYALKHSKNPENIAIMIERDDKIPPLSELLKELEIARTIHKKVMHVAISSRPAESIL